MRTLTGHWLGGLSLLMLLTLAVGSGMELRALASPGAILERIAATAVTPRVVAIARRQHERPVVAGLRLDQNREPQAALMRSDRAAVLCGPASLLSVLHLDTPPPATA